jgi:hypothetical protein
MDFIKSYWKYREGLSEKERQASRDRQDNQLREERKKHIKDFNIKLDSGKEVRVHMFSFSNTYGNMLFGTTDSEYINKKTFEEATYPSNWGTRKAIKIQPSDEEFQEGLKPFCFTVWLDSKIPLDSWYDGSELVVIWFDDIPNGATFEEIIRNGVKLVDWEANAHDYEI